MNSTLLNALFKPHHFEALIPNNVFLFYQPSQGRKNYINSKLPAPVTSRIWKPESRRQKGTSTKQLTTFIVQPLTTTPKIWWLRFLDIFSSFPSIQHPASVPKQTGFLSLSSVLSCQWPKGSPSVPRTACQTILQKRVACRISTEKQSYRKSENFGTRSSTQVL